MPGFLPLYSTSLGDAYLADSLALLKSLPASSINAVVTSPPYALHFKKEYGNADKVDYVAWFVEFGRENPPGLDRRTGASSSTSGKLQLRDPDAVTLSL